MEQNEEPDKIKDEIDARIKRQIIKETAIEFSNKVFELKKTSEYTYIEAILKISEESGFEPDKLNKLLTSDLKDALEEEAQSLSLLKEKRKGKLF